MDYPKFIYQTKRKNPLVYKGVIRLEKWTRQVRYLQQATEKRNINNGNLEQLEKKCKGI